MRQAVLTSIELPDFGLPTVEPELGPGLYRARIERLRARLRSAGLDACVIYGDREHVANISWASGYDPRFEEALLGTIENFPVASWDAIIAINCSAAFHTIRTAIPGMKARKWGRIINTASAHSTVASPFKSAYVTAKHGLNGLTKTVALEVATFGITANCISPGYVWTPLVEAQIPATMAARNLTKEQVMNDVLLAAQPTKQFVTVEQVAALAVFLCSDAAAAITGANMAIDGGWTAA